MAPRKEKVVFTAEAGQLDLIHRHIQSGKYRSASEFLREAIDEKLIRLRRGRLAEQVDQYCDEPADSLETGLIQMQAFEGEEEP